MAIAVVAVEDVLIETDGIRGQHPVADVMRFVGALSGPYKVVLSSTATNETKLEYLLQINGIIQGRTYDSLLLCEPQWRDLSTPELRVAHFNHARLNSGMVSLYIDTDSVACAKVMQEGGNVLLWKRAQYMRAAFRPDKPRPKAWAELEAEAERQVYLRREDERVRVEHEESEFQL